MIYGHDKTIYRTGHLDIETDPNGNIVSVWFRCLMLPFRQVRVNDDRAKIRGELRKTQQIKAIEIEDAGDKEFRADAIQLIRDRLDQRQVSVGGSVGGPVSRMGI